MEHGHFYLVSGRSSLQRHYPFPGSESENKTDLKQQLNHYWGWSNVNRWIDKSFWDLRESRFLKGKMQQFVDGRRELAQYCRCISWIGAVTNATTSIKNHVTFFFPLFNCVCELTSRLTVRPNSYIDPTTSVCAVNYLLSYKWTPKIIVLSS